MSSKNLFLIGSSHHSVPLEIREKLALSADDTEYIYNFLKDSKNISEFLVLNTCNRVELYGVSDKEDIQEEVTQLLSQLHDFDTAFYKRYSFWKRDLEVIRHIFEVASGIDSQIIGENEIFGQVKDAFREATENKTLGSTLNKVFQKSFQAAKWIRSNTSICRGQISIGSICVDLASRIFGSLEENNVLVVGTGEVAEKTLEALQAKGCSMYSVTGRNIEKSRNLANLYNGSVIDFETFQNSLSIFDIIISSTSASGLILSEQSIRKAVLKRKGLPVFLIDLAVPRDVDPKSANLGSVFLYNMDDLSMIANENLKNRQNEVVICKESIQEKATYLWEGMNRISQKKSTPILHEPQEFHA